jgi:hypothetical protein
MRQFLTYSLLLAPLAIAGCLPAEQHGGGAAGTGSSSGGGSGANGTGGTNSSDPTKCGVQNFMLAKGGTPDLLIVQDISGSMGQTEDDQTASAGTPSKWTEISAAIQSVVGQIDTVDWGLMMFPSNSGKQCAPSTADVPVGASTAAAITTKLMATTPNGSTPTADTVNAAVAYLQSVTDGNAKYIVLATDGEPNSCSGGGDDAAGAEKAITAAAAAGISTFVVGIGTTGGAQTTLNAMAVAGKQAQAGATSYYPVTSQAALESVLKSVTGQIVSCSYALQTAPANPDLVEIQEDGATIPRDKSHMNGWDFGPNDLSINFYGTACSNLQNGSVSNVAASYGCPPIS